MGILRSKLLVSWNPQSITGNDPLSLRLLRSKGLTVSLLDWLDFCSKSWAISNKLMACCGVNSWYDSKTTIYRALSWFIEHTVNREIPERRQIRWVRFLQCYLVCYNLTVRLFSNLIPIYANSGWDIHDAVYSKELLISNKANGYRDITAIIDLSSFRRIPWERNVPFFLVSFLDPDTKEPLPVDPRGVLKLTTDLADSMGYQCYSGVEYEVSHIFLIILLAVWLTIIFTCI